MESLDYYDILPKGMGAYLASHGHHFSKAMYEWACSMMRDKSGKSGEVMDRKRFDTLMMSYGQRLERTSGYYDGMYVWAMAKSDYLGGSLPDEKHLAMFVKEYTDDIDGNPTRAFDEFFINCTRKGVDIPWEDMI